jgi:hypothetical protein
VTEPKRELRERILAKLIPVLRQGPAMADAYADAVMSLFYEVADDWDRIDITTLGESGRTFLDQRWLACRVPVQTVEYRRPVDRRVTPEGAL